MADSTSPAGALARLSGRPFYKMNGAGNSIVVLDARRSAVDELSKAEAVAIHHTAGLAFDQLMILHDPRSPGTEAFVRIINNDGSEAGACGNGTRCVAWALLRLKETEDDWQCVATAAASRPERRVVVVETVRGLLECQRESPRVFTVDMGCPQLEADTIPLRHAVPDTAEFELDYPCEALHRPAAAGMGNPHAVFFLNPAVAQGSSDCPEITEHGPVLETHEMFPEKANISFAHVLARDRISLRVWERGVGITKACGSAACATLVSAVRRGLTDRIATVSLPGGDLRIHWREADNHVLMTGPVELEHEGVFA